MYIHNVPNVFSNYDPLVNFIDLLIDRGYYNTQSIPENCKDEISALVMDSLGDDQSYAIFDTDEFNDHCNHLKNFFRFSSLNDVYSFAKKVKSATFSKYEYYISLIMNELKGKRRTA